MEGVTGGEDRTLCQLILNAQTLVLDHASTSNHRYLSDEILEMEIRAA